MSMLCSGILNRCDLRAASCELRARGRQDQMEQLDGTSTPELLWNKIEFITMQHSYKYADLLKRGNTAQR